MEAIRKYIQKKPFKLALTILVIVGVLSASYFLAPSQKNDNPPIDETGTTVTTDETTAESAPQSTSAGTTSPEQKSTVPAAVTDQYKTDPIPDGKPKPQESQDITVNEQKKLTCTISIRCDTVLHNTESLKPGKEAIVPKDGVMLRTVEASFSDGENVFDVLRRVTRENKIHMEFQNTPIYNSAYIEGIGNLYEFDCGPLSGWMYKVNDWFPNYGCSRYLLKDGDKIEWIYTCDLGADIGGAYSTGQAQ